MTSTTGQGTPGVWKIMYVAIDRKYHGRVNQRNSSAIGSRYCFYFASNFTAVSYISLKLSKNAKMFMASCN